MNAIPTTVPHITPELLWQWADEGWLRRLDAALAHWVLEHDAAASPGLLTAVAILSHLEGKGHTCLPLVDAHRPSLRLQLPQLLRWPAEAAPALHQLQQWLPTSVRDWHHALLSSRMVWQAGTALDFGQPLVLTQTPAIAPQTTPTLRLYLRRYWQYEQDIAHSIAARIQSPLHPDTATARHWLDVLFPDALPDATFDWQKAACALALRQRLAVITGGPGTGKTYTAARLLAAALALEPQPEQIRIGLAAPTGKAAARLKESIQQALAQLPDAVRQHAPLQAALHHLPPARTLHALLGARPDTRQMRHNASHPLPLDWLLVDEASMIHLEMMHNLLQALPPTARLILLGDKDQLASVEAGAVLGDFCAQAQQGHYSSDTARHLEQLTGQALPQEFLHPPHTPAMPALAQNTVMLRESRRFGGTIGQLALAINRHDMAAMQQVLQQVAGQSATSVHWQEGASLNTLAHIALHGRPGPANGEPHAPESHSEASPTASYAGLVQALRTTPHWPADTSQPQWLTRHTEWVVRVLTQLEQFRILCATREGAWGVEGINRLVIGQLQRQGIRARQEGWFAGRIVQVTQNDANLGIFNGDIGICLPSAADRHKLRVYFPADAASGVPRSIATPRMAHVETAFAMTIHKSQGSEFAHVLMVLPPQAGTLLSKELIYTGLTRARKAFTYLSEQPGTWQQAVQQPTLRASGLADTLQALASHHHS